MTNVLVLAEHHHGQISPMVYSTLGAARLLSPTYDVLLACEDASVATPLANREGVAKVWTAVHPRFSHIIAEDLAPIVAAIGKEYTHILAPATTFGKNVLPRVAATLEVAQISEITSIHSEDCFTRPIYAGNAYQTVQSHDPIKVITVRATSFEPVKEVTTKAPIQPINMTITPDERVHFQSETRPTVTRPELGSAKIVVAGGRGLKSAENFKLVESLADKLGAAIGATRAAVDAGFVPNDWQVGQTGKVVAPALYIAIGISGAIQHIAGMKDSKIIVAINQDPDAPIFQIADYGLVGDLFTILPELEKAIA